MRNSRPEPLSLQRLLAWSAAGSISSVARKGYAKPINATLCSLRVRATLDSGTWPPCLPRLLIGQPVQYPTHRHRSRRAVPILGVDVWRLAWPKLPLHLKNRPKSAQITSGAGPSQLPSPRQGTLRRKKPRNCGDCSGFWVYPLGVQWTRTYKYWRPRPPSRSCLLLSPTPQPSRTYTPAVTVLASLFHHPLYSNFEQAGLLRASPWHPI